MPRSARLDAPGILHHVIVRGIEGKDIFRDRFDQENFVDRLSLLVPETQTSCYAWVLMGNHAHFLFRSGDSGIAALMRRLLTGYAVTFNRRHKRHGQLFQNRYKSIICQEDAYLKELVRYIHLNPLRAKMVKDFGALNRYAFCGHRSLAGKAACAWQDDAYVLRYFGQRPVAARKRYLAFVKAGTGMGRRPELVGGGLVRSLGGWAEVKKLRVKGMDRVKGDERILGDSDFVLSVLAIANERFERSYELKRLGYDMNRVAEKVAEIFGLDPDDIFQKGRQKARSTARSLFCYWCSSELGISKTALARRLQLSVSGVGYAAGRGEALARRSGYRLIQKDS